MLSTDFTFTKRQLGWILLAGGMLTFAGIVGIDIFDVGREGGIGPAQQLALVASILVAIIGLSLIPIGEHPA